MAKAVTKQKLEELMSFKDTKLKSLSQIQMKKLVRLRRQLQNEDQLSEYVKYLVGIRSDQP